MDDPILDALAQIVAKDARRHGCTCPEIVVGFREVADDVFVPDLGHDPACPLLLASKAPEN